MNRRLKILLTLAALAATGFLAASVLIAYFFPYAKFRAALIDEAQNQFHRQIKIGKISWSLVKGLTVDDFAISESPDFSRGTFARLQNSNLQLSWKELLNKKIVVSGITVKALSLSIKKTGPSSYNFSNLWTSSNTAVASPNSQPQAPHAAQWKSRFRIQQVKVLNGNVSYDDPLDRARIIFSNASISASHIQISRPFFLSLKSDFSAKASSQAQEIAGNFEYSGSVEIGSGEKNLLGLDFTHFELQSGSYTASLSGKITGGKEELISDIQGHLAYLKRSILLAHWKGTVRAPWSLGQISANGKFSLKTPTLKPQETPWPKIPVSKISPIDISGDLRVRSGAVSTTKTLVLFSSSSLKLSGTVDHFSTSPRPHLKLICSIQTPKLTGQDIFFASLPPSLPIPALKIEAQASLNRQTLQLSSSTFRSAPGDVVIKGTIENVFSKTPLPNLDITTDLKFSRLRSKEITWAKLSKELVIPATHIETKLNLTKNLLTFYQAKVSTHYGTLSFSGPVSNFASPKPQPHLMISAAINLPAFESSDLPFHQLPPGIRFPSSRWDGSFYLGQKNIRVKELAVSFKRNAIELSNSEFLNIGSAHPTLKILVKCPSFDLPELTPIFPSARKLKLIGHGFFAVAASGPIKNPILEGKLKFENLGMGDLGFDLSHFSGIVSFNENRIDAPDIYGSFDGSKTHIDLTIKNYAQRPFIDAEIDLSKFNLDHFFAARDRFIKTMSSLKESSSPPKVSLSAHQSHRAATAIDSKGILNIDQMTHPKFRADGVRVTWNVQGITPDLKTMTGHAHILANHGKMKDLGTMVDKSILIKILASPLIAIQKITSFGGIRLFPNFNNITFQGLSGDYNFANGIMLVNESHVYSDAANVSAKGKIDIPRQNLDMHIIAQVANIAPMKISVQGKFDKPKVHVDLADLLLGPAKGLIKGIFGN